jgi:hypothetical protein
MKKALCLLFLLSGCAVVEEGQKIFYWQRPNTGVAWFSKDHNECMKEADWFPFEWPGFPWGTSKKLNLRFDNESANGVWAQFVPYPGAQPVYVNYASDDWSVDYDDYQQCMEARNYSQRMAPRVNYQVFPE